MPFAITLQDVKTSFEHFDLSVDALSIHEGERFGIAGKNGAGKSTLLDIILGVKKPDSGLVDVFGKGSPADNPTIKQDIGFVIDKAGFPDKFTVLESGKVMSRIYPNWSDKTFLGLLDEFDLNGETQIKELSRGMDIKFNLALAMSHSPKMLILDEVTSGIDPISRFQMLSIVNEYIGQSDDRTLVFTTHIMDDFAYLAGRIGFMGEGRFKAILAGTELKQTRFDEAFFEACQEERDNAWIDH